MKPYQQIFIQECGEPLVSIPRDVFSLTLPHPYEKLGADYRGRSPYAVRQGVLKALTEAQTHLQQDFPGWRIQIFDAYRPVEVQQFMVNYTFACVVKDLGVRGRSGSQCALTRGKIDISRLILEYSLSNQEVQEIWQKVYQIWAIPSYDPATPPPHSTGAAVDITLIDGKGEIVDMGGGIDELSDRSHPDHYVSASNLKGKEYHEKRELLFKVMRKAGFRRHFREWWHFSLGDQMWAWLENQEHPSLDRIARYGRID